MPPPTQGSRNVRGQKMQHEDRLEQEDALTPSHGGERSEKEKGHIHAVGGSHLRARTKLPSEGACGIGSRPSAFGASAFDAPASIFVGTGSTTPPNFTIRGPAEMQRMLLGASIFGGTNVPVPPNFMKRGFAEMRPMPLEGAACTKCRACAADSDSADPRSSTVPASVRTRGFARLLFGRGVSVPLCRRHAVRRHVGRWQQRADACLSCSICQASTVCFCPIQLMLNPVYKSST